MVFMAERFLQYQEKKALQQCKLATLVVNVKSYKMYVDNSHCTVTSEIDATRFLDILNNQHPKIQYTMELENSSKSLNFLDLTVINPGNNGKYEFKVCRKKAITDVQIRKNSCHDPKIMMGVFKGFAHRAIKLCTAQHLQAELEFLVSVFVENGYHKGSMLNVIEKKRTGNYNTSSNNDDINKIYVSLPWVPGLSTKLKKIFSKAGYKPVFKSGTNLQNQLSNKNKPILGNNSKPGVYKLSCSCGKNYIGETKLNISSRVDQHHANTVEGRWERSAVAEHYKSCHGTVNWQSKENTLKVTKHVFQWKVREALEIQYHQ